LPENLFESEFFGHEKGSFTGATSQRIGLIEAADGSSLFLDEMGEMPLSMQVKLLHFLENGAFRRVGATRDRKSDVRIIAATNRPLELDVKDGRFRTDLFYRLNVVSFHLPPLRERREDIEPLIDFFLERLKQKFDRPQLRLSDEARSELEAHEWRGNVRELRNTLERTVVLTADDEVKTIYGISRNTEISDSSQSAETISTTTKLEPLAEIEKQHILRVLQEVGGKRERAAAILGITSRTLYRKLQEFSFKN
ncbi:MAG: sigma-54-dependent Fis family transcriptional regulator, partial [Pyrinomonadaceae bacterium]|nr:sigma-54-dependent Fis family transcriptional regulator [Pyrinomonadaceae bacterium]